MGGPHSSNWRAPPGLTQLHSPLPTLQVPASPQSAFVVHSTHLCLSVLHLPKPASALQVESSTHSKHWLVVASHAGCAGSVQSVFATHSTQ